MISRREVVVGAGAAVTAVSLTGRASAQAPRVRKNIGSLPANDPVIQTYRRAVTRMMALPVSDRRSWYRQAKIHNDVCPHGNWFFPPWHREYIRRFEEIVREVAQEPSFDLPFWDWNTNRQIPSSFWGNNNPLNPANLDFRPFAQADAQFAPFLAQLGNARRISQTELVGNDTDFSLSRLRTRVIQAPSFVALASASATSLRPGTTPSYLENQLHGNVHTDIGGQMSNFFSPLDPIFWLHHANVDRLWSLWQRRNPSIAPPASWRNFSLPAGMFVTGQGAPAPQITCSALESTEVLGYTYEPVPNQEQLLLVAAFTQLNATMRSAINVPAAGPPSPPPQTKTFAADAPPDNRTNDRSFAAINVSVPPQELPAPAVLEARETGLVAVAEPIMADLTLGDLPSFPDARYRVFINCDYLSPSTPRGDPSYVTTVSLFGLTHGDHQHGTATVRVDLSGAVAALDRAQRPRGAQITVQLQPEPLHGDEVRSNISFRRAEVAVTQA